GELLADPALEPAPVLALVAAQVVDLLLQADPLVVQLAERLVVAGLGLAVQVLRLGAAVPLGRLGAGGRVGQQRLGLALGVGQGLVRLGLGLAGQPVGGLLSQ